MKKTLAMIGGITLFAVTGVAGCGISGPSGSSNGPDTNSTSERNTVSGNGSAQSSSSHTPGNTVSAHKSDNEKITAPVQLSKIQMSNKLDGWGEIDVGNSIRILSTKNDGKVWNAVATIPNTTSLHLGHSGFAWYTTKTNGGSSTARVHFTRDWGKKWAVSNQLQLPSGRSDRLQLLFAPGHKNGWLSVTAGAMNSSHILQLWMSTDEGAHWNLVSKVSPSDILLGFQNSLNGWAEWAHAGSPIAAEFASPKASSQRPKVDSAPALYRTTDGGRSWRPQFLPVPKQLIEHNGLAYLSNMRWFGRVGIMEATFASDQLPYQKWGLYSTTDGGSHWSFHLVNGVSNNYGHQTLQVTFDLTGSKDLWETVTQLSQPSSHAAYEANSTTLYHSLDVGQKWSMVGKTPVPFESVQFVSPSVGFGLASETETLYRTVNGGHSWSIVH